MISRSPRHRRVFIGTPTSSFTNSAGGLIYLGRGPQASVTDAPADVALNQTTISTGINVASPGTVSNQGTITLRRRHPARQPAARPRARRHIAGGRHP